jgi:hypothetical protein
MVFSRAFPVLVLVLVIIIIVPARALSVLLVIPFAGV